MPYKPIDYSKCCIYKIEHVNDDKLIYIGNTTNFKQRKSAHKTCCNNENTNQYNYKVYKTIRENGGWKMFKMIEIEKVSMQRSTRSRTTRTRNNKRV